MKRLRTTRPNSGFTLLEVVVAMGILATGLLSIAAMQVQAMRGGRLGRHHSAAAAIAFTQLEQFNRVAFTDPLLAPNWPGFTAPVPVLRNVTLGGVQQIEQQYNVQFRVRDMPPIPPAPPLPVTWKAIDVRVTWTENQQPGAPGRTLTISTIRHDDPASPL